MESDISIAMNVAREVCAISKPGGIPLTAEQIVRCTKIATVKVNEVTALIKDSLKDDETRRSGKK